MNNKEKKSLECQRCGNQFFAFSNRAKYCSDCKLIIKREKHRVYIRAKRLEARKLKHLKCQSCGCDITEIKGARKFCHKCKKRAYSLKRKDYYLENKEAMKNYQKKYYQVEEHKIRHRELARNSARRISKLKKQ